MNFLSSCSLGSLLLDRSEYTWASTFFLIISTVLHSITVFIEYLILHFLQTALLLFQSGRRFAVLCNLKKVLNLILLQIEQR